jgi:small subunit ribosomal protein S19
MAKKEFAFRGKTLSELQAMDLKDFAQLANSRAKRSLLRGFDKKLLKKIDKANAMKKEGKEPKPVRTHGRDSIIIPAMVGLRIAVHKGNSFEIIEVKPEMLGHYLGEMVMTRKKLMHGKAGIGATKSSTAITARK